MHKAIALVLIIFSTLSFASDWMWNTLISRYQFEKEKQAYCYRNKVGRIVGENIDKQVRPASVTKLYVSLWALDELGKDFRFETKFHVFEDRIHIEGQLDPFFTTENLYYIISSLNDLGYEEIKTLSFDKKFLFNWSDSPSEITELLKGYLNTDLWNEAHKLEFENLIYQNDQLGLNLPLRDQLNFSVEEVKFESIPSNNPILTGTFKSSPIHRHLKQMNIYSTNFIAMKIFDYLGGQKAFAKYMKKIFQVGTRTISFQNGAGFEPNVTTCRLTIQTIER
ncbi:MAG: D-alanyl-D-alanine carboxypeptidase, partial [Bacteriovoracaceae bacterium]|nr:D-alanyl-D-alanine carboxypeptidase [Bacteriovoracaceae bacterium]